MYAASMGSLKYKISLNHGHNSGCEQGFPVDSPCIELLIKAGVSVNATDQEGGTALMHAASMGYVKGVSLLLRSNAKINLRKNDGHNSIETNIANISDAAYELGYCLRKGPFYPSKQAPLILLAAGEILKGTTLKMCSPRGNVFTIEVPDFLQHDPGLKFCLKHLCREAIRNHLITLDPHSHSAEFHNLGFHLD